MNERQLTLIEELTSICHSLPIELWLRGGWAVDFFIGRVTREHEDIDLFIWATDAPALARELDRAGLRPKPDRRPTRSVTLRRPARIFR